MAARLLILLMMAKSNLLWNCWIHSSHWRGLSNWLKLNRKQNFFRYMEIHFYWLNLRNFKKFSMNHLINSQSWLLLNSKYLMGTNSSGFSHVRFLEIWSEQTHCLVAEGCISSWSHFAPPWKDLGCVIKWWVWRFSSNVCD